MMFKRKKTIWNISTPARLIFHHNPLEGFQSHEHDEKMKKKEGIPVDADVQPERPVEPELKEVRERFRGRDYALAAGFQQDPRKKEDFRFLPPRQKLEYLARLKVSKEKAESYLASAVIKQTSKNPATGEDVVTLIPARQYIETARRFHMQDYNNAPAYEKVPKVTPGLRTPELALDTTTVALGGTMMEGIAAEFPTKPSVIPGSGDPSSALRAFESFAANKSEDELKGSTVLVAFDREMFTSGSFQQYMKDAEMLFTSIKEKGMVAVVSDPLNLGDLSASKENWKAYRDLLAELYQKGYIGSLLGMAAATTHRRRSGQIDPDFFQGGKFTDAFNKLGSNGFVAAVNLAHGHRTLDAEGLPVERAVSSDAERYYYGPGKNVEGSGETTELLPPFPCIADIQDERVKRSLQHLGVMMVSIEFGAVGYTRQQAEEHIHSTQAEIDRAEQEGHDMKFARLELNRTMSDIYFVYAWLAYRRYKGRIKGQNATRAEVVKEIDYAERMNLKYGFHSKYTEEIDKLKEGLDKAL